MGGPFFRVDLSHHSLLSLATPFLALPEKTLQKKRILSIRYGIYEETLPIGGY
jgi:hypothetical protein